LVRRALMNLELELVEKALKYLDNPKKQPPDQELLKLEPEQWEHLAHLLVALKLEQQVSILH
jgi:hypothetical protein